VNGLAEIMRDMDVPKRSEAVELYKAIYPGESVPDAVTMASAITHAGLMADNLRLQMAQAERAKRNLAKVVGYLTPQLGGMPHHDGREFCFTLTLTEEQVADIRAIAKG
jgi:hypothetical protein